MADHRTQPFRLYDNTTSFATLNVMINTKRRGRPRAFARDVALASAMEVFWAYGFDGASIPRLTTAMGISAQSFYAAFGSKDALYRESIECYRSTVGGFGVRALTEEADALAAVTRLLRDAAIAFSETASTPGCMITTAPAGMSEDPLTTFGRQLRAESQQMLTERLKRGVQEMQIRSDADCEAWARYIMGIVQGLSVQARDAAPTAALLSTARIAARSLETLRPCA